MQPGEMKGLSIRNYPIVFADLHGVDAMHRMLELLPPDLRGLLASGGIAASGWYPVAYKCALHEAGRRVASDPKLAWTMGAEMTRRDLRGIYRTFVRVVSPRFVLNLGAQLFSTYLRPGRMQVLESRPGFVRVSFDHCSGFTRDLWQDVLGGCQGALEVAGATDVRLRVEAGAMAGDRAARGVAFWTAGSRETDAIELP